MFKSNKLGSVRLYTDEEIATYYVSPDKRDPVHARIERFETSILQKNSLVVYYYATIKDEAVLWWKEEVEKRPIWTRKEYELVPNKEGALLSQQLLSSLGIDIDLGLAHDRIIVRLLTKLKQKG